MIKTYKDQSILFAVGYGANRAGCILHASGEAAVWNANEWKDFEEATAGCVSLPENPGVYVWTGDICFDDGRTFAFEASDPDERWVGTTRAACIQDFEERGMLAPGILVLSAPGENEGAGRC